VRVKRAEVLFETLKIRLLAFHFLRSQLAGAIEFCRFTIPRAVDKLDERENDTGKWRSSQLAKANKANEIGGAAFFFASRRARHFFETIR